MGRMKEFDLELAKAENAVQTKKGWSARIICYDKVSYDEYPILALVRNPYTGFEELKYYNEKGEDYGDGSYDLVMASVKKEVWVNIYKIDDCCGYFSVVFNSKKDAEKDGENDKNFITTQKIEWEE